MVSNSGIHKFCPILVVFNFVPISFTCVEMQINALLTTTFKARIFLTLTMFLFYCCCTAFLINILRHART